MIIEDAMMIANTMNAFHHAHNFLLLLFKYFLIPASTPCLAVTV